MKTRDYAWVAGLLLAGACQKNQGLPQGLNATGFSCEIDGQSFTPSLEPIILTTRTALEAKRTNGAGGFVVQAKDSFNELLIYVAATHGPGTYPLAGARNPVPYYSNPENYAAYTRNAPLPPGANPTAQPPPARFYTTAAVTGTVTLTRFDTVGHVVSGSFEYTAREDATGRVVRITNGRLNVKLN